MNLLALDTSTDQMSVAVQRMRDGVAQVWQHQGAGGAQSSTRLIPAIEALMAQAGLRFADLSVIAFGCGPGSFTGLRTACSVAQGLAFGAGLQVLPVDSLLAVAQVARMQHAPNAAHFEVMALLDARMDEIYVANYVFDSKQWIQDEGYSLISPQNLAPEPHCVLAGNVFEVYAQSLPELPHPRVPALPLASAMLQLAPGLLAQGLAVAPERALPRYIRDKVAQTTQERAAQQGVVRP